MFVSTGKYEENTHSRTHTHIHTHTYIMKLTSHPRKASVLLKKVHFSETLSKVEITLPVPSSVKPEQLTVKFGDTSLYIAWPKQEPLDIKLAGRVDSSQCWWGLDQKMLSCSLKIVLEKTDEKFWNVLVDDAAPVEKTSHRKSNDNHMFNTLLSLWNAFLKEASPYVSPAWFSYLVYFIFGIAALCVVRDGIFPDRTYAVALYVFQKMFGLVFLGAWISAWSQVKALVGERGILPLQDSIKGNATFRDLPTLFHFVEPNNYFLILHCHLGMACMVLFVLNIAPSLVVMCSCLLYLSIKNIGQEFWALQFDNLLLEVGWSASIVYAGPMHWVMFPFIPNYTSFASRLGLFLCWWLLFRLLFSSGVVKLMSRDASWADCTALYYHYWSQPLPTFVGYYVHAHLPKWVHRLSCWLHFVFELVAPFAFFVPWLRSTIGFGGAFALQVAILLTGNYGFF